MQQVVDQMKATMLRARCEVGPAELEEEIDMVQSINNGLPR